MEKYLCLNIDEKFITDIPAHVYSQILIYLSLEDILNLRSTCQYIYETCFCKEFFHRLELQPRSIRSDQVEYFKKFIVGAGRFVKLNLNRLELPHIKLLTPYFRNIMSLSICINHLPIITEHCLYLKQLELYDSNPFFFQTEEKAHEFLGSLSLLTNLDELVLRGCNQAYQSFVLMNLFANTKSISAIVLDSLTINEHKNMRGKLQDSVYNAINIKKWTFCNVLLLTKTKFILPPSVESFNCFNSVLTPLNEQHTEIKHLLIDGMVPYFTKI